ncbi:MAG: glycosyltransferase [Anaerolineaceae bacterium]|nr:glycosyltransferase [Anaerolineaceae bacterium]
MTRRGDARGLRVCWVDTMRYTQPLQAGQARKWRRLTEDLGVDIFVTSFAPGLRPQCFREHARFIQWPALPLAPLRWLTAWLLVPPVVLWLVFARRIDVLIAHDPVIGAAAALAKALARLAGRRVALVVETRGDFLKGFVGQRRMPMPGLWLGLIRRLARYSLARADALRAVSASSAGQLREFAPQKPLRQFMSWTDAAVFQTFRVKQSESQRQEVLYAGVLIPRKGIRELIEAYARIADHVPQVRLRIVGEPANRDYASGLRRQVSELGLESRITIGDPLPQAELAVAMARARLLVLPSYSEGLPKVLVEAMLCGTPVLASAVDGIPEIVEDGVHGWLVPPGDVTALAGKLLHALCEADLDRMGETAREFATHLFSAESYVKQYGELFVLAWNEAQR